MVLLSLFCEGTWQSESRGEGGGPPPRMSLPLRRPHPWPRQRSAPKQEDRRQPGLSHPSPREGAVCAPSSRGCIFSLSLDWSSLTKKCCRKQCWLACPWPTSAAQRPRCCALWGIQPLRTCCVSLRQCRHWVRVEEIVSSYTLCSSSYTCPSQRF